MRHQRKFYYFLTAAFLFLSTMAYSQFDAENGIAASATTYSESENSLNLTNERAEDAYSPESHVSTYYRTDNGKLYWQKKMPVFLFVSPDANGKDVKKLESESTPNFANPLYLDTEGVNYIRTKWAVDENGNTITPQQEIMFEIYADSYAPVTSVTFNGLRHQANGVTYFGKGLTVSAKSVDQLSGVKGVYQSLDQATYSPINSDISVNSEGDHNLKIYSVDNVGNVEEVREENFVVDITAPKTSLSLEGTVLDVIVSAKVRILLESEDNLSGVERIYYQLDEDAEKRYGAPISLQSVLEGVHRIKYYAKDNVGNKEEINSFDFFVDRSAPTISAELKGDLFEGKNGVYVSQRTLIDLASEDNKSGVKEVFYSFDKQGDQQYNSPIGVTDFSGTHSLKFYAVDKVNNGINGEAMKTFGGTKNFYVDSNAPKTEFWYEGNVYKTRDTTFITSQTLVGLKGTDNESGMKDVQYTVNGATSKVYSDKVSFENEGLYLIEFTGTDNVNNQQTDDFFFVVDNTGPVVSTVLSAESVGSISLDEMDGDLPVYSKGVQVYLAATDAVVDVKDIYYTLNGGAKTKYEHPITLNTSGVNEILVTSVDKLGNETEEKHTLKTFIK